MSKRKPTVEDVSKIIRELDAIKDGTKVIVSYTQSGMSVAFVAGRWARRDPNTEGGWCIFGSASRAFVMLTDRITIFRQPRRKIHLRIDLTGARIPQSQHTVVCAKAAGLVADTTQEGGEG